ncbi:MAG TPA: amidohydrolase family protein [Gemmatimonadaceae bacterium]|nr:amidohydrolase family protein [Gemmatimonadaceae bacterium]
MRYHLVRLAFFALLSVPAAGQRPPLAASSRSFLVVESPVVALTHVTLIDGTGAAAREDQTILLRDGRIDRVGATGALPIPAAAKVLDLTGHTVIPGLVGLHEHTYLAGLSHPAPMLHSAMLYLAAGVTTAMTAGSMLPYNELNMKRQIDRGALPGPRLYIGGPYLTGPRNEPGPFRIVESPEDATRVVNYWADEGATWFKILNGPSAVVRAVVNAVHARGLKVSAHLCAVTFIEAEQLGVDVLQHGFITNSEYVPGKQPDVCPAGNQKAQADVDPASPEVMESIRRIVAGGAPVVSTLGVYESFSVTRSRLDTAELAMLAPSVRREVEETHAGLARTSFTVPDRLLKRMMQWEQLFVAAGGLLGAGCDPWGTGFMPGYGDLRNYELLIEAGFSVPQVVQIMTLNGARILGEQQRIGSVEPGKAADLVVLRGNLSRDISAIRNTAMVFRDGYGFDPVKLRNEVRGKLGSH